MNTALIYEYCEVISDRSNPHTGDRAIFFFEGSNGYVQTNIADGGEYLSFSCNSLEEFEEICEDLGIL